MKRLIEKAKVAIKALRSERGGFLGIENSFAGLAISAAAFGALTIAIPPGISYAEVWRCKTTISTIALAADQWYATSPTHQYPGNGTQTAVTAANFENPITNAKVWITDDPIDFSSPTKN